ncbi:MAG: class I SAM-dependent methyltransferase [Blastochloris sp.]|nr:class I SAM-dependent methyltransferase [Blastochloris sp.]
MDSALAAAETKIRRHAENFANTDHYLNVHLPRIATDFAFIIERFGPGQRILDIGAAPFCLCEALAARGYDVTAVDFDPKQWPQVPYLSMPVIKCDVERAPLPFPDKHFDLVVLTEVFEHLHVNLVTTILEIQRVIRPGGMLYLTTPNLLSIRKVWRMIRKGVVNDVYDEWSMINRLGYAGHICEYTMAEVRDFLAAAGFVETQASTEFVYNKRPIETMMLKALTAIAPAMRENVIVHARRPAGD